VILSNENLHLAGARAFINQAPILFVVLCLGFLFSGQLSGQGALTILAASLSSAATGTPYATQTLSVIGGTAPYFWVVLSGSLPTGLTLSNTGVLSGTPLSPNTYSFVLSVTDSSSPVLTTVKAFTIAITASVSITDGALPNGTVDTSYPATTLTAAGGTSPYSWSVVSRALPPGLVLSGDGIITGIPSVAGTFVFTISVSDSSSPAQTASKTLTIVIQPKLTITTSAPLPVGAVGVFYTHPFSASGPTPLTWSTSSGSLPPGMTLSSNGTIAGTPTLAGSFDFTIQAASSNPVQTATQSFRIVINPALAVTTNASLADAALASPYSVTLEATGGVPPYTWTTQARLPAGLTLSSSGTISGTPVRLGTFLFAVQVSDSFVPRQQAVQTFSVTVVSPLSISTISLPSALQNSAYSQQLKNIGGTAPFTWVVTNGLLPAALTLTTSGLLQGTPTTVESQTFDVTVTDSRGTSFAKTFSLAVDPPLSTFSAPSVPATAKATQQLPIAISLDAPHPSPLSGQLKLTFTSKAEVPANDPMTQFSTGSRSVNFTIAGNSKDAVFTSPVLLLIGTVAGTVVLAADIENGPTALPVATIEVLPFPPQVTRLEALTTPQGVDLIITGYSPARRITSVDFNFDIKSGGKTRRVTLSRNVDAQFAAWYQNPASVAFGSAFSFTQSIGRQGSGTIEAVTVTLKNAQGNSSSAPVRPQ